MAPDPLEDWMKPDQLAKQLKNERELVDSGNFDGGGHFGSYYAYRKGTNKDFIKLHAVDDENAALLYAQVINAFLELRGLRLKGRLLDVGCAIGTITNALREISKSSEVYGFDMSDDAIQIAKEKYPDCKFSVQLAEELSVFPNVFFDIIHANGFYPFYRTSDEETHLKYLSFFAKKLKPGGIILLRFHKVRKGLHKTYKRLCREIRLLGFSEISFSSGSMSKLFKIFPFGLSNILVFNFFMFVNEIRLFFWENRYNTSYLCLLRKAE